MLNIDIKRIGYGESSKDEIISNIKISLSKGDILLVKGSTGCGKTTILKFLAGLGGSSLDIDIQGSVMFQGKSILDEDYPSYIGFLFQDVEDQFLLNTVYHEIYLPLDKERKAKADMLIHRFGLQKLIGKLLKDLSSGERKLIALISVLVLDRPIMILDEPFANLDPRYIDRIQTYFEEIRKHKIIIIASHEDTTRVLYNKFLVKKGNKRKCSLDINKISEQKGPEAFISKPQNEIIFSMKNINYRYADGKVVSYKGLYKINKGDVVLLQGNNGSGKTTLINIISGRFKGDEHIERLYGKSFGLVFQEPEKQLFGNSVYDEITLNNKKTESDEEYIDRLLRDVGLYEKKYEHPFFLSRGQKQVVLILSILLASPELLIFDEPFTGMDEDLIEKVIQILGNHYKKNDCTIIFSDQNDEVYKRMVGLKKIEIQSFISGSEEGGQGE